MPLSWTKLQRFHAMMNGVFIGVGIIFLLWGATDIIFPIADRMNVAVFGLMRIILGIISLSVGIGVEAVQWAKMGTERVSVASEDLQCPQQPVEQPLQTTSANS